VILGKSFNFEVLKCKKKVAQRLTPEEVV